MSGTSTFLLFIALVFGLLALVTALKTISTQLKTIGIQLEIVALEIKTLHKKLPRIELLTGPPPEDWHPDGGKQTN